MDKKGDFIPILYGEWKTDVKLLTNTKQYIKQNKRMNEYNGISATKIVQIYKHTFFKILLTG